MIIAAQAGAEQGPFAALRLDARDLRLPDHEDRHTSSAKA